MFTMVTSTASDVTTMSVAGNGEQFVYLSAPTQLHPPTHMPLRTLMLKKRDDFCPFFGLSKTQML